MFPMHWYRKKCTRLSSGFTIVELLLVVGIIAILSSIVIIAINPTLQLSSAADSKRNSYTNQLQKAMVQYLIDNGSLPGDKSVPNGAGNAMQLCRISFTDTNCINIDDLVSKYMPCLPRDGAETNALYTGYSVYLQNGIVQVTSEYVNQELSGAGNCEGHPDPVAYWKFDEGTDTTASDESTNGYNGTLTNMDAGSDWVTDTAPTTFSNPYALEFDGTNDRVTVPSFDLTGSSMTLSAWFKATAFPSDSRIISKATGVSAPDHYWMMGMNNAVPDELRFRLFAGGSATTFETSSAVTGVWTHMAVVYDGEDMIIYKDGSNVGSQSKSGDIRTGNVEVWLGDNQPQGSRAFSGILDDIRIYDATLSPTEISMLADGEDL